MSLSNAERAAALDNALNATHYIGLSSTAPGQDGSNITEPVGGAYARVTTLTGAWDAATSASPSVKATNAAVTFPTSTGTWGAQLTHLIIMDAPTGGNMIASEPLDTPQTVGAADITPEFAAGALVLRALVA